MAFAVDTGVPVDRTKGQIEAMLRARGATEFINGWSETEDRIKFRIGNVAIQFTLPRVDATDPQIASEPRSGRPRSAEMISRLVAKRDRSRWRSLYLVIKAKLEAVDAGIAIFEKEFLAFVVMRDGTTVGDLIVPQIQAATAKGGHYQLEAKAGKDGRA